MFDLCYIKNNLFKLLRSEYKLDDGLNRYFNLLLILSFILSFFLFCNNSPGHFFKNEKKWQEKSNNKKIIHTTIRKKRPRHQDNEIKKIHIIKSKSQRNQIKKITKQLPKKINLTKIAYYKISKGDCLWTIAQKLRLNIKTIIKYNKIQNPNYIRAGDRLKIVFSRSNYSLKRKKLARKKTTRLLSKRKRMAGLIKRINKTSNIVNNRSSKRIAKTINYRIIKGDNLWRISKKYHLQLKDLIKLNQVENPDFILAGKTIIVPII